MKTAVLGPGGVGGFLAGTLARSGEDVVVVARDQTAELIAARGLEVRSAILGDFTARPRAVTELGEPVDALFVATKAPGLAAGLERVRTAPGLVIPLLNGIDHLALLRRRFGAGRVAAGVIRIESDRVAPGVIVQSGPSCRIDLASAAPEAAAALPDVAALLARCGIPARIEGREATVMWSKLARLCPLALTTSASDRPLGFVRSDPRWRSALEGAINETVTAANAEGAGLDPADTLAELESAHERLGSSMQRDLAAGREPELDAIAGPVLRAARRHGLRSPTVQWLADRVATRAGVAWV